MHQPSSKKTADRSMGDSDPRTLQGEGRKHLTSNKELIHKIAEERRQLLKELADL